MLAVTGPLQRLPDTRKGANVADGGNDQRHALALQRAERDLDHHLAAVGALGDQFHLRPHRPWPGVVAVSLAVRGVARADAVGHQYVDRQTCQFLDAVSEKPGGLRIGEDDVAGGIDEQQRIRVGHEQRGEDAVLVDAGRQRKCRPLGRHHRFRPRSL